MLTKSNCTRYSIHLNGEYAVIFINQMGNCGELAIYSSFGTWGYIWSNFGHGDFVDFLIELQYNYFFKKVDEEDRGRVFDCEGTIKEIKKLILEDRRNKDLEYEDARSHIDDIISYEKWHSPQLTKSSFYFTMSEYYSNLYEYMGNHDYPTIEKNKPSCEEFWNTLWKEFINNVKNV